MGHRARLQQDMRETRTAFLFGKPEGKRPHERPQHRWEEIIKEDIKETGCEDVDWLRIGFTGILLQTWQWTFGLYERQGTPWSAEWVLASQCFCSMELLQYLMKLRSSCDIGYLHHSSIHQTQFFRSHRQAFWSRLCCFGCCMLCLLNVVSFWWCLTLNKQPKIMGSNPAQGNDCFILLQNNPGVFISTSVFKKCVLYNFEFLIDLNTSLLKTWKLGQKFYPVHEVFTISKNSSNKSSEWQWDLYLCHIQILYCKNNFWEICEVQFRFHSRWGIIME